MKWTDSISSWIDTAWTDAQSRSVGESPAFKSRPGMSCADLTEAVIRYRIAGDGPQTLVLAVDAPAVIEHYDVLIKWLEKDFRVVVFETPGCGFSFPRSQFRFDFLEVNDLVAELLRRLALGPYFLAFPCVSAYGAIDLAARFPSLVAGVVIVQAPSWSEQVKWKHGRDRQNILSRPVFGQLALQLLKRKRAPLWLDVAIGRREMVAEFVETTDAAFSQGACFCLASAFQRYLTDAEPPLTPVAQPTLIIWGESDRSHRNTDKSSTRQYCSAAVEVRFEHAGHFPELEEPQLFAQTVRDWVNSLKN